jgi:hypothetical protein
MSDAFVVERLSAAEIRHNVALARAEMARGAERLQWQVPERFALIAQAWG